MIVFVILAAVPCVLAIFIAIYFTEHKRKNKIMKEIEKINKETLLEIAKRIEANEVVKKLQKTSINKFGSLIGGAVVDIALGKEPKDYDIVGVPESYHKYGLGEEFVFISETMWAYTYMLGNKTIQFLKKGDWDFEFKISQSKYELSTGNLFIDKPSFDNRTLIPVNFHNTQMLKEGLVRLPHWRNKGFIMCDTTYKSVLETLFNTIPTHS